MHAKQKRFEKLTNVLFYGGLAFLVVAIILTNLIH